MAAQPHTADVWIVRPGEEDEFVRVWDEFARWTAAEYTGSGSARLLQDELQPNRFLSVGPWQDAAAIERWRASDGFRKRVGGILTLLERFEPGSYVERSAVGGDPAADRPIGGGAAPPYG